MASPARVGKTMTLEEFLRMPGIDERPYREFIDGRVETKMSPQKKHGRIGKRLMNHVDAYSEPREFGESFPELRCTFAGRSIIPDVVFLLDEHIETDDDGEILDPTHRPPDLHVEIVSPDQSVQKCREKLVFSTADGCPLGWLIDPIRKTVHVFRPGRPTELVPADGVLEGDPVVPGYRLPISELFAWLKARASSTELRPATPATRLTRRRRARPVSAVGESTNGHAATADHPPLRLVFDEGTLIVEGPREGEELGLPGVRYDFRTKQFRAEAIWYRTVVEQLRGRKRAYQDVARAYEPASWELKVAKQAFPHQVEGLKAWWESGGRGVVVLPTGTGKTHLANMAIEKAERPTLVVTPTIDLMNQWYDELTLGFDTEVGLLGGGYYDIKPLTVTTYDSAYLNMDRIGDKFGLIVFDECHHLPGPTYGLAATCAIAPFRLGLTATPERADLAHTHTDQLIGPIVYRREITQLRGHYLADYSVMTLYVQLSDEERTRYEQARELYRGFLRESGVDMRQPNGWSQFIYVAHRSPEGREAFRAYREQRELALAAPAKLNLLGRLLERHNGDRVLIFTHDNATVYKIAREFLVPVITHQTKTKERRDVLLKFNSGAYPIVATSRVLNEGVNVPEANVAVVLSGSGSVREHVQRLGRVLRKSGDKEAVLYEVITRDTVEEFTSNRRRQHSAYDGKPRGDDPSRPGPPGEPR